ncbi:hypothetical protein [Taibaiella soli]|uniref:Transcriptional regulator n=1 Tax=Taibaiella soli TaxID=1649169 RepID=A0A2W2ARD4_9BACT|nr:hypothetical protein [Taibaiella soli]PZF75030.1 hypothetical protein DN068_00305 [Taibaiella soli]
MNQEKIIALLILDNRDEFSNSYQLCKILAWKFKIISCDNLIKNLCDEKLIDAQYTNGLGKFTLTTKGKNAITQHWKETTDYYTAVFPDEAIFINKLKLNYTN